MSEQKLQRVQEIANRGLQDQLPENKRAIFDEAVKRGLISIPQQEVITAPQEIIQDDFVPTEENLAIQPQGREELSLVDKALGALEAIGTLATGATTGAAGFALGSLEGVLGDLTGQLTPEEAQEVATRYAGFGTYQPRTEAGQRFVKDIGEKLGSLPPVLGATPAPVVGAAIPTSTKVRAGIEATKRNIGEFLEPVGRVKTAANKGNLSNFRLPKDNGLKRKILAEQTLADNPDIAAVTKVLQEDGSIITNPASKRALKTLTNDLGEEKAVGAVSVIENMRKGSKKAFRDMLKIIEDGRDKPLFGQENRPSDVLGKAVADRARDITRLNERAGKRIGAIAKNELSKSDIDISSVREKFYDSMGDLGVNLVDDGKGGLSFDFSQSKFVGGNKELINRLNTFLKEDSINGFDAHKLKQFARELVDFGEGTESAISAASQSPINNLASDINSILVNINPSYAKANKVFADSADIVQGFNRMVKNVDLGGELANQSLANKARRLVSNAESRGSIKQLFDSAEKVLADNSIRYTNDLSSLNYAVTVLEDSFKITPPASFQGGIQRAGVNLAQGMTPGTAVGTAATEGLMNRVFNLSKPDFDQKMKAFKALAQEQE